VLNGVAYGGGLELALACDLRLAAPAPAWGSPKHRSRSFPARAARQRLPRVSGLAAAKELISPRGASRRRGPGDRPVNAVAEPGELSAARRLARAIAANGPLAVRAQGGHRFAAPADRSPRTSSVSGDLPAARVPSADRLEALAAFRDKRPPVPGALSGARHRDQNV